MHPARGGAARNRRHPGGRHRGAHMSAGRSPILASQSSEILHREQTRLDHQSHRPRGCRSAEHEPFLPSLSQVLRREPRCLRHEATRATSSGTYVEVANALVAGGLGLWHVRSASFVTRLSSDRRNHSGGLAASIHFASYIRRGRIGGRLRHDEACLLAKIEIHG
jgi:hypothetical protein